LGKTNPSLAETALDNLLLAVFVFTLSVYFNLKIDAIFWIKIATVLVETVVVGVWLREEMRRTRIRIPRQLQPTE
jgi:Na+-driven multidrug efflux pump